MLPIDSRDINQEYQLHRLESLAKGFTEKQANASAAGYVKAFKRAFDGYYYRKRCNVCHYDFSYSYPRCPKCRNADWSIRSFTVGVEDYHLDESPTSEDRAVENLELWEFKKFLRTIIGTRNATKDMDEKIIDLLLQGYNNVEIGKHFSKTKEAIRQRVEYLKEMYRRYCDC